MLQRTLSNDPHAAARADLAAAFRWAERYNWHEAVANHFSFAVSDDGKEFLMNPNGMHFSRIRASDLLLLNADESPMDRPDAPDPTAWGLHGALHRNVPWAKAALHIHSRYATVLATLEDPVLPPIDQNSAMFFNRVAVDSDYGGLALEEEGERVCSLLSEPKKKTLIMGNHGVMVVGETVAEAWNTLYYFERAAETYILALQTGRPLKLMPEAIAESTAAEIEGYGHVVDRHLTELKRILDAEGSDYAS